MLTTRSWFFFLAVLAVTCLGLTLPNALLSVVGFSLLIWFLGAWLSFAVRVRQAAPRLFVVRRISDERGRVDNLWIGRSFTVKVQLRTTSLLAFPFVLIRDRIPAVLERVEGQCQEGGRLAAGQPLELNYRVSCPVVGRAQFDGLELVVTDLQGFFVHQTFVRVVRSYRVLPAMEEVKGRLAAVKHHNLLPLLGQHRHPRPGTGSELLDLRDYLPGDPPKTIAWKVSARRNRLMTKEFESEVPIRCTLFVDVSNGVRVGGPRNHALGRLVEIAAAVVQLNLRNRDLTGLCLFDEVGAEHIRPARGRRHQIKLLQRLADAAELPPATAEVSLGRLLPLAYGLAQEEYPDFLSREVNAMPVWLPLLWPQPAYTRPRFWARPASWWKRIWARLRYFDRAFILALSAPLSPRAHRHYRWRKKLAALLAVRYGLAPGGLAVFLEDDNLFVNYLQKFLAEHQVYPPLPYYDDRGKYLFASPGKLDVLAKHFLRSVRQGRDNELFVLMADLLDLGDHLGKVQAALKVALSRHHQVMVVCPWPADIPLPPAAPPPDHPPELPSELWDMPESQTVQALLQRATVLRFHRAFFHLRRSLARLRVPVVCARAEDPVPLILNQMEHLRGWERGGR